MGDRPAPRARHLGFHAFTMTKPSRQRVLRFVQALACARIQFGCKRLSPQVPVGRLYPEHSPAFKSHGAPARRLQGWNGRWSSVWGTSDLVSVVLASRVDYEAVTSGLSSFRSIWGTCLKV